ncbi:MAG TPA: hypothetical protein VFZ34_10760 [Blastocatellia bacterium]|nr:hypothetical protein [Blastocatellia bacterium]
MQSCQINYQPGARESVWQLFRRNVADEDLILLAGALAGATVEVSQRKVGLFLEVRDAARFESYQTSIRQDSDGSLWAFIHEVRVAAGKRGQGLGIAAFAQQAKAAQSLGLTRFELWATGDFFDRANNGYYTWARFGFDAPLTPQQRQSLPASLAGSRTVNEVIRRKGYDWWKKAGSDTKMVFYLHTGSAMMKTLLEYVQEIEVRRGQ